MLSRTRLIVYRLQGTGKSDSADDHVVLRVLARYAHPADCVPHLHHRQHAPPPGALHRMGVHPRMASGLQRFVARSHPPALTSRDRQEGGQRRPRAHPMAIRHGALAREQVQDRGRHLVPHAGRRQAHHPRHRLDQCHRFWCGLVARRECLLIGLSGMLQRSVQDCHVLEPVPQQLHVRPPPLDNPLTLAGCTLGTNPFVPLVCSGSH